MLKITETDGEQESTLVLEGKLVEPWVAELERAWVHATHAPGLRSLVVDLKDVTVISQQGEELLFAMLKAGAELRCREGVLTRHVLERLGQRRECHKRKERA